MTKKTGRHTGGGYKYVHSFIDNRGKRRWRYTRRGYPSEYLPEPTDPTFLDRYTAALQRPKTGHKKTGYTLGHAIDDYLKSRAFTDLADGTKPSYESLLHQIGLNYGRYILATLTRSKLELILSAIDSTSKRKKVQEKFSLVLEQAVRNDRIASNVARDVSRIKHKPNSYKAWTLADIETFKDAYGEGTTERLALYLLYYTGQRSSDVVTMGNSHIQDGRIIVTQKKTGTTLSLPIHPRLASELPDRAVWVLNGYSNPFSAKGFQQWLVKRIKRAGLTGLSGHGLRKSLATNLANAGATPHQIRAVTGHKNLGEVALYTQDAEVATLADQALKMLD